MTKIAAFDPIHLLLNPFLLWQGKRFRPAITRLPEPDGPRRGVAGEGPDLRLLVVGDSSGVGVGVATQDEALLGRTVARLSERHRVTYRLEARHGSTLSRTLRHLRKQAPEPFDVALVAIGVNDIMGGRTLGPWLASFAELAAELRGRFAVARVVVSALPPVEAFPAIPNPLRWVLGRTVRRYDRALQAWAEGEADVSYFVFESAPGDPLYGVPLAHVMAEDGFHPGPRIYDEWGRRAALAALDPARENPPLQADSTLKRFCLVRAPVSTLLVQPFAPRAAAERPSVGRPPMRME